MNQISVSYPETFTFSLKMRRDECDREIKTASLVQFYELGKVSSGFAAQMLGVSRFDFLERLAAYGGSAYTDARELEADLANA